MTVRTVELVVYPKVLPDNTLQFDLSGIVPREIPYFRPHPEIAGRFIPLFQNCDHRGTITKKLTNCDDCTRTREVWYCNHFKKEVFPITCHGCIIPNENK